LLFPELDLVVLLLDLVDVHLDQLGLLGASAHGQHLRVLRALHRRVLRLPQRGGALLLIQLQAGIGEEGGVHLLGGHGGAVDGHVHEDGLGLAFLLELGKLPLVGDQGHLLLLQLLPELLPLPLQLLLRL